MLNREKRLLVTKYNVPVVFIHILQTLHWTSKDRHRLLINRTRKKKKVTRIVLKPVGSRCELWTELNRGIQSLSLAFHWVKTKINSERTLNLWDLCHETRVHVAWHYCKITTFACVPGLANRSHSLPIFQIAGVPSLPLYVQVYPVPRYLIEQWLKSTWS